MLILSTISRRMAIAAVASLAAAGSALAETTLERARDAGFIRVGFANEAPYGYADSSGKLTGEAPEVAKAVLKKMGIEEVDGVLTEFGSLIPGLRAGRFDIIAAGMFINPKRCQAITFSEPSYSVSQAFLVKAGNPKDLTDFGSVAADESITLAVMSGAIEKDYAVKSGVSEDQIKTVPDGLTGVAEVQSGRADALALTSLSIANLLQKGGGEGAGLAMTEPFDTVAEESVLGHGGFGFRKEDEDLLAEFNKHLTEFVGTEEHIALVEPFGFGAHALPKKSTAELCAE